MKPKLYLLALAVFCINFSLNAQSSDSFLNGMIERINQYYLDMSHDNLYLQTERSVYFPGDEIYLEAFVMDAATLMPSQNSNQYKLMLVNNEGKQVYSSAFNVSKGRSSGKFQIPENVPHGPYQLIGFPMNNQVNTANKVFNKVIFLADPKQGFMLDYDLDQASFIGGEQLGLNLKAYGSNGKKLKGLNINYTVKDKNKTISDGGLKSDKNGSAAVSFTVPSDPDPNMRVEITVEKRKERQALTILLPVNRAVDHIDFHPEGGALILGSAGKIAFRAFDDEGKPVDFSGSLYGDGQKIADLKTFASGLGSFKLVPEDGKKYEIRTGNRNFELPSAKANAAGLRITGQSDGKLHAEIAHIGDDFPESTAVLVAILRKGLLYWSAPGTLKQTAKMDIPIKRIPSGVSTLAVFSKGGELITSRTFYLEAQSLPELEIALDKPVYKHRQKVTVDLSLQGKVPANTENVSLTVSVVPKDLILDRDLLIDEYMMIESDILEDGHTLLNQFSDTGDPELLDAMLLALTWNGYSWEYALGIEEGSDISGGMINEEVSVASYTLSYPEDFNASPMVDYSIGILDRRHPGVGEPMYKRQLANGISVLEVIKTMKPLTMSGGKILFKGVNSFYNQQGALIVIDGQQAGDNASILSTISPIEVDEINISTNPGEIQKYTGLNVVGVIEITLKGSSVDSRLKNETPRDVMVRKAMGSYMVGYPDYSVENDARSIMEDHRSLLYWDPEVTLDENNTNQFDFYTSDNKGVFVVTVQGMVGLSPVAKQVVYEVK